MSDRAMIAAINGQYNRRAYRANELCIRLTNSKFLIASPRNAGVNGIVKSLKCCRFSPRSISCMLLTILSSATLAQALPAVCSAMSALRNPTCSYFNHTNLVGKPEPVGTASLLFIRIIFAPTKQKDQAIHGLAGCKRGKVSKP